ncbi:EamA-like transporter family protein [Shimia gijangensis]|uniref:EamA-like transporter family protein n=1 Tax=Shimia gijangensis TaxID=1470563 RepID=A0A1M6LL42_9RHOB|nr:EamA-like transporter family protein [Shimia gijangensis]
MVLGEGISPLGLVAIIVGVGGVLVLSGPMDRSGPMWRRLLSPSAALGLSAGALFGVSAVCYRGATLAVSANDPLLRALVTLAAVTSMQLLTMAVWLYLRDRPQIGRVLRAWKTAGWIGLTSMAGSFSWFTAFTLQNAAYVKAVGQIELIFGIIGTVLFFREKISSREWVGMLLLATSIMALMLTL